MTVCRSQGATRWYLVRTKIRAEGIALEHLERQGYRVYHPRLLRSKRVRGRWVDRVEPLFPRYLFLRLDTERQSLAPVRSTVGVTNIVRFGVDYAIVPDEVINELMHREDAGTGLHRLKEPLFERGTVVRVSEGPFDRLEGVFECFESEERVVILLEVLGRVTRVRLPLSQVIPELAY